MYMGEFDHIVAALQSSPLVRELTEIGVSGDFSRLEKNEAKRHHFLSQFLLRGFAQERNGKHRLFQMEAARRGAPRPVDIRTAASRRRLYTGIDEQGEPSNRNEGYLALVESHAAPALRKLIDDPASLSPADRATIAFFVALQEMRTPAAAQQVTAVANAAFRTAATELLSDRRAFAERHREAAGSLADDEEIERLRQETLNEVRSGGVRLSGEGGAAFGAALEHAVGNVAPVFAFDWTLLVAPDGGVITSDRGIAISDPTPPFPWVAQGMLSSENSTTFMPLSDTHCLAMRPGCGSCGLAVSGLSALEVETLNLRVYGWADTYVFGKSQEGLARVRIAARRRPADVVRPKPFCQVALIELDPDDTSLADANRQRGWPAHVPNANGEPRDYIVIPADAPYPELLKQADELTERRARKRAGIGPDEPFEGRIRNQPLHPLDMIQ
jgi:Protein of unknown function (DUF4238)